MQLQALLVDRFQAEEHVLHPELAPVAEYFRIAAQHVGASLEVVLFFDLALFDFVPDRKPMLGRDERDVIDDEDVWLLDRQHVLCRGFRRRFAVTAAVERPRAAERTIPR